MLFKNKSIFIFSILLISVLFTSCVATTSPDSTVKRSENDSLVIANLSGVSRKLPEDFIGFNANLIKGPSWSDTAFLHVLKTFHPELIRFPGGTVANYWDWQNGWFMNDIDLPKDFSQRKPLNESLEDFANAMKYIDAKPVFDLNILNSDVKTQEQFLMKAKSLQLPIQFIELGNEFYLSDKNYVQKFSDGNQYGLIMNDWMDSLKKIFPEAKYAIVGNGTQNVGKVSFHSKRRNDWNEDLLSSEKRADVITFHFYYDQVLTDQDLNNQIINFRAKQKIDSIYSSPENNFSNSISNLFSNEQTLINLSTQKISQLPSNLNVWITESNTTDRDNSMRLNGTWLQGLYVSNLFTQIIMQPRVQMLLFHQASSTANFGAIFNDTGAFNGFVNEVQNKKFGISAVGYSMKLIMNAVNGMSNARELSFSTNDLHGILFSTGKNKSILLLNLGDSKKIISLDSIAPASSFKGSQVAIDPLETITGFEKNIEKNILVNNDKVTLPPYSLTVLFFKD
jgi:hypothetical protein